MREAKEQMFTPAAEELSKYRDGYKYCPIRAEILSDIRTPIEVLRILKHESDHVYMLESVENQENWGRYTFLGFEPKVEVTCIDGRIRVTDEKGEPLIGATVKPAG